MNFKRLLVSGAFPYKAFAISFTALLFAILLVTQRGSARESWTGQRQAAFARWQAANPNSQSAIADYLKKSAELIAQEKHPTDDATPVVWRPETQSLTLWQGPKFPEMVVDQTKCGSCRPGSPAQRMSLAASSYRPDSEGAHVAAADGGLSSTQRIRISEKLCQWAVRSTIHSHYLNGSLKLISGCHEINYSQSWRKRQTSPR